jgi:hypothetical protein
VTPGSRVLVPPSRECTRPRLDGATPAATRRRSRCSPPLAAPRGRAACGLLLRVALRGGHLAGGDGFLVLDQLQYLNWLRQAVEHVLVGNLYDLAPGPRCFLHPGLLVSARCTRSGSGCGRRTSCGSRRRARAVGAAPGVGRGRFLARPRRADGGSPRSRCLFASPGRAAVGWLGLGGERHPLPLRLPRRRARRDELPLGLSLHRHRGRAAAARLLAHERGRTGSRRRRARDRVAAAVAGRDATCCVLLGGGGGGLAPPATPAAAPRLAIEGAAPRRRSSTTSRSPRLDLAWELAGRANDFGAWPWWVTAIGLAPLPCPARVRRRRAPDDVAGWALRLWPLAALCVFVAPAGRFPAHAFQGLALPLAVLAGVGVGRRVGEGGDGRRAALLVVPGTLYRVDELRAARQRRPPAVLPRRRRARGAALARRGAGARRRAGAALHGLLVPAWTRRETWVGAGSWTPGLRRRTQAAERLFSGRMDRAAAEALCAARAPASYSRLPRPRGRPRPRSRRVHGAAAPVRLRDRVEGAR